MTELRWGSATDVGLVREGNEDQLLVASPLFAVADGMGGARGGEVASTTAVEALRAAFDGATTADELVEAVKQANRAVFERAGDPKLRGMGTTLTALALLERGDGSEDDELAVVNVGDSRSYLLRDGELQQLTDDHNVPGELLRRGEISADEAAIHPQRNLVTRVLGVEDEVDVDVWRLVPFAGDRYLLASDGLFGEVSDERVATTLRTEADPQKAAQVLVDMARDAGGHDNITVVVVDVVDDGGRAESASKALAGAPPARRRSRKDDPTDEDPGTDTEAVPAVAGGDEILPAEGAPGADAEKPAEKSASTLRLLALVVVGALIGAGTFAGVTWYGRSTWYLDTVGDEVMIYRGRPPAGFLWVEPELVESTSVEVSLLPPEERELVDRNPAFDSVGAARSEAERLERRSDAFVAANSGPSTTTTTSAPPPPPPTAPEPQPAPPPSP